MPWTIVADTDIGGREEQQDRYLIENSGDGKQHLLVVADGAGGHETGAAAAQEAVDCIAEDLPRLWSTGDPEALIKELIIKCNKRVLAIGGSEMACSTLVITLIRGDEIFWGHVGDSRLYLIRNRSAIVTTVDHSVIELQGQRAAKDPSKAITAPSNKLYMCLGALRDVTPDVASSLVREGDTLLLCSDGLWAQTNMRAVVTLLSDKSLTPQRLKKCTLAAKNSKQERSDNITLVAARFTGHGGVLANSIKSIFNLFKK